MFVFFRMCKRCEKYQYHILKTGFWTLPNYLLVNVDRYVINHNDRVHGGFKKDAMLKIPEYGLDLRPYMTGPLKDGEETLYDFKANVVHLGYSILRAYCEWLDSCDVVGMAVHSGDPPGWVTDGGCPPAP